MALQVVTLCTLVDKYHVSEYNVTSIFSNGLCNEKQCSASSLELVLAGTSTFTASHSGGYDWPPSLAFTYIHQSHPHANHFNDTTHCFKPDDGGTMFL